MRAGRSQSGTKHPADQVAPGEVHAWLIDLNRLPYAPGQVLGVAERARAASYLSPQSGARFAASRAWLRVILGRYLSAEPECLEFSGSSGARAVLTGEHAGLIHFSLSRSADRAIVAVSRSPVGADVEVVRARAGLADLVTSRFAAAEARCIADGCGGSALRGFYRHWTAKEAYLKATGYGLAGLRTTELSCGARPDIRFCGHATSWTLSLLNAAPDCAVAIVGSGCVTECLVAPQ